MNVQREVFCWGERKKDDVLQLFLCIHEEKHKEHVMERSALLEVVDARTA